jgi:hypothetical protein
VGFTGPTVDQVEEEFDMVAVKSHPRRIVGRLDLDPELLFELPDKCLRARLAVIDVSSR